MKLKRNLFLVLVWAFLALCGPAFGLLVLEPGYMVETYTSYSPTITYTYGMTFDNAGNLYLDQAYDNKIWRVKPDRTASVFVSLPGTNALDWTGGTAYGNYLYTLAYSDLVRIALNGTTSTFARGFPAASEVAVDRTGNYGGYIFVSTGGQDHIYRVDISGNITMFSVWPGWTDGGGPVGLEFDTTGNYNGQMYVATYFDDQSNAHKSGLFVLDTAGNASRFCNDLVAALEIAFDTTGLFGHEMFVVGKDTWVDEYSIWRVATNGSSTEFAASTGKMIGSLVFGPDGALYVSEYSSLGQVITVSRIIPEPATLFLFGLGILSLLRKRKS